MHIMYDTRTNRRKKRYVYSRPIEAINSSFRSPHAKVMFDVSHNVIDSGYDHMIILMYEVTFFKKKVMCWFDLFQKRNKYKMILLYMYLAFFLLIKFNLYLLTLIGFYLLDLI